MGLVRVLTFESETEKVFTEDEEININSKKEVILVHCRDYCKALSGDYDKPFTMEINNSMQIMIVDPATGKPLYENPGEPDESRRIIRTIGEYKMMKILNKLKYVSIEEALESAILRKKKKPTARPYVMPYDKNTAPYIDDINF